MNFSQKLVKHFYQDTNLQLAAICRLTTILMALVMALNFFHVFKMGNAIYPILTFSICVMFLPTILYNRLKLKSEFLKYFVLTLIVLMSGLLYIFLSYHVILMLAFPIVIACLYCDRKSVLFTSLLCVPVLVISHLIAFKLHMVPDEPLITLRGVICYGIIPRLIELCAFSVICYSMAGKVADLVKSLVEKNDELYADQMGLITMLSQLTHMQSHETGDHIKRVSEYTRILCSALGMDDDEAAKVSMASMMHDIGKLDVPLSILEKPGKLTPDEFEIIKTHVTAGHKLLADSPGELMQISAEVALEHHERWDGTGYLHKKGDEISLYASCVAIADVFDALVSARPYKMPWTPEEAKAEILSQRGKQFNPRLVDLFEEHFDEFLEIYNRYSE